MQLSFFPLESTFLPEEPASLIRKSFSHNNVCPQAERIALEEKYGSLLVETNKFNRKLVSYQGNKGEIVPSNISPS